MATNTTKDNLLATLSGKLAELVAEASGSVYMVGYDEGAPRTAFQISDTHIVSVARWAEPGETVSLYDAAGARHAIEVAGYDMTSGIVIAEHKGQALGQATDKVGSGVGSGSDAASRVGELALTVALPSPEGIESRMGMIRCVGTGTRLPRGRRIDSYLQTDMQSFPGFLGAPLLAADGSLRGITMPAGRAEGFVLPTQELSKLVDALIARPTVGLGRLGVHLQEAELPESVRAEREGQETGVLVTGLEPASPAGTAGVQVGDILVGLDELRVQNSVDLMDALVGRNDSDVSLVLSRAGELIEISAHADTADLSMHGHHGGHGANGHHGGHGPQGRGRKRMHPRG